MGYSHDLKCPTNMSRPQPVGVCDRCSEKRYLDDLVWQYDYRGRSLQNLRIRVCKDRCLDKPNPQLQPVVILGPEGTIKDPRPPAYAQQAAEGGNVAPSSAHALLYGDIGGDE